jgi:methionine aminopeptidase
MIKKINPLNSIGNSVVFILLLVSCILLADSLVSIKGADSNGAIIWNVDPEGFTIGVIMVLLSIWNMSLHSQPVKTIDPFINQIEQNKTKEISDEEIMNWAMNHYPNENMEKVGLKVTGAKWYKSQMKNDKEEVKEILKQVK